jgi:hypothetical protein
MPALNDRIWPLVFEYVAAQLCKPRFLKFRCRNRGFELLFRHYVSSLCTKSSMRWRHFEVRCHAQLVAEPIESRDRDIIFGFPSEFGAVCAEVRRVGPARIAAFGVFNLDHFRAEACENQRGKRPGECDSQIEDGDSIEGLVQVYFSR